VADLQAQLSEKQSELQALSLENMALAAKARALEQLVKSAGGSILLCCCDRQLVYCDCRWKQSDYENHVTSES